MADTVVKNDREKRIKEEQRLLQIQKQREQHELQLEQEKGQTFKVQSHELTR